MFLILNVNVLTPLFQKPNADKVKVSECLCMCVCFIRLISKGWPQRRESVSASHIKGQIFIYIQNLKYLNKFWKIRMDIPGRRTVCAKLWISRRKWDVLRIANIPPSASAIIVLSPWRRCEGRLETYGAWQRSWCFWHKPCSLFRKPYGAIVEPWASQLGKISISEIWQPRRGSWDKETT